MQMPGKKTKVATAWSCILYFTQSLPRTDSQNSVDYSLDFLYYKYNKLLKSDPWPSCRPVQQSAPTGARPCGVYTTTQFAGSLFPVVV